MKNKKLMFWFIIALVIAAVVVIIKMPTKLGLDLVGGSRLVLEAQTTNTISKITPDHMSSLQFAIENRVNALGVAETVVQQAGEKRLLIEIPNISDPAKAKEFLLNTKKSVGEISELCGFSSSNYFGLIFKQKEGLSPANYRKHQHTKN